MVITFDTQAIISIVGTLVVCAFSGYTLGSIIVYFLTTNIKSKERNAIFMALATVALAVIVNWLFWIDPLQIAWNSGMFILAIIVGFVFGTRSIIKLKFESPLPEGLPLQTEEDKSAIILLTEGVPEEYNPLPYIREYRKKKETDVEQKAFLLQPFEFFKIKRKYAILEKNQKEIPKIEQEQLTEEKKREIPHKNIVKTMITKLEKSFLDFDMYQEAFVNDWPTINQAILRVLSLGATRITILNTIFGQGFKYDLFLNEFKRIDYSDLDIAIKETPQLAESEKLIDIYINQINSNFASDEQKDSIGILLLGEGQPPEWDSQYRKNTQENNFLNNLKQELVKKGFNEDYIQISWLKYGQPTFKNGIDILSKKCLKIFCLSPTYLIENLETIYDIPTLIHNIKTEEVEIEQIPPLNADDEIIKLYLNLITSAETMPLDLLGDNAKLVLQATKDIASLEDVSEITEETKEDEEKENEEEPVEKSEEEK
ncbi:MAG: hypothetical protein U9O98_00525 [Asgard group archaeon]|nr:hypothetical protein [Asgard group archaeon]